MYRLSASLVITMLSVLFAGAQVPFGIKNRVVLEDDAGKILEKINKRMSHNGKLLPFEAAFLAEEKEVHALDGSEKESRNKALVADYNAMLVREAEKPGFAEKLSTGIVIKGEVDKLFPTLVGDITTYRLKLWQRSIKRGRDKDKKANVYLPFSFVSKLSGSNEDNTGTVNDATTFFGAPLTFRLSPNLVDYTWNEGSRFVLGMHHDLRLLPVGDTTTDKIEAGFGYYGSFGFSFFNDADVFDNESNSWIAGKWSFSALVYVFRSGGKFKQAVFGNYDKKSLSGFECMLRFATSDDASRKFNFFLGTNLGLTEDSPNYKKWDFRIGIGN